MRVLTSFVFATWLVTMRNGLNAFARNQGKNRKVFRAKEYLITGGTIVTVNENMDVLTDSSVYIKDGIIEKIGSKRRLRPQNLPNAYVMKLDNDDIIFPGLINTHGHVYMKFLSGVADDEDVMTWLFNTIFPLEGIFVSRKGFCDAPFELGVAEMLQGGTTTFVDVYFWEDEMAQIVENVGIRAVLCESVIDFAQPDFATPSETLIFAESFLKDWVDDRLHPLVTPCVFPHAPYTTSPWIYKRARELVDEYGGLLGTHLAESSTENSVIQERYNMTGLSSTQYLADNNFLTNKTVLAHSIWLSDTDMDLIADAGSHTSHNPSSDMKLANGIMSYTKLKQKGINVCIGTDGPASNNNLDMLEETRIASFLAKIKDSAPTSLSAEEAVYAATMGGAKAIGKESEIGSIEEGKAADLVIIKRRNSLKLLPAYDPYSELVYTASGDDVFATMVAGKVLYYI